jgi:hypothetical protein
LVRPAETADLDETPVAASPSEAVELTFWESIRDTEDTHLLVAYLEKFPQGEFAVIAHARLKAMRNAD